MYLNENRNTCTLAFTTLPDKNLMMCGEERGRVCVEGGGEGSGRVHVEGGNMGSSKSSEVKPAHTHTHTWSLNAMR